MLYIKVVSNSLIDYLKHEFCRDSKGKVGPKCWWLQRWIPSKIPVKNYNLPAFSVFLAQTFSEGLYCFSVAVVFSRSGDIGNKAAIRTSFSSSSVWCTTDEDQRTWRILQGFCVILTTLQVLGLISEKQELRECRIPLAMLWVASWITYSCEGSGAWTVWLVWRLKLLVHGCCVWYKNKFRIDSKPQTKATI